MDGQTSRLGGYVDESVIDTLSAVATLRQRLQAYDERPGQARKITYSTFSDGHAQYRTVEDTESGSLALVICNDIGG
jgi:hypothetical protein